MWGKTSPPWAIPGFNVWYYIRASLGLHVFFNGCVLIKDLHSPQQQVPHLLPQVCDSTSLFIVFFFFFTGTTDLSQSHSCWECSATQCYCLKILPVRKWLPRSLFSPSIFSPRKAMGTLEVGFFFVCQSNSKQFKILSSWGFSISCRLLTLLPLKRVAELLNISLS